MTRETSRTTRTLAHRCWLLRLRVGDTNGVVTDDITGALGYSSGNYTNTFGGTSAAAPQLAGVAAVMLQANPKLGWRDVQDILSISARHTGSEIGSGPQ